MSLALFHDTIAAVSTAKARSALAIVRISGSDAIRIVGKVVESPESLWTSRSGTSFQTSVLDSVGAPIDEVVISVFRSPRSFTGEDLCEITCHGSVVIADAVLARLIQGGARPAEPGEFSRRAFVHGKIGREDAELIGARIDSSSEVELRGVALAIHEKYSRLRKAYDLIISLLAQVDAQIDFGESDHVEILGFDSTVRSALDEVQSLIQQSSNRRANTANFTLALTGPPNVGKSSLFNALLQFERSIVSDVPGTTRDYVEGNLEIDGFIVKLIDTAGVREADESIERKGIALGQAASVRADFTLRVTDPTLRNASLSEGEVAVHNKRDLDDWGEGLSVSALTSEGLPELHEWLREQLQARASEFSVIALSDSERSTLISVSDSLSSLSLAADPTLSAEDLRAASAALAALLGLNVSQDSLNHIFSKMCIGK